VNFRLVAVCVCLSVCVICDYDDDVILLACILSVLSLSRPMLHSTALLCACGAHTGSLSHASLAVGPHTVHANAYTTYSD